jgi:hypothetical protein
MTIWDYLPAESLETIPEEDAVRQIGDAIGVDFQPDAILGGYRAKVGKCILTCEYDRYSTSCYSDELDGDLFISTGFDGKDQYGRMFGAAAPRDSIQEAIDWFRDRMK